MSFIHVFEHFELLTSKIIATAVAQLVKAYALHAVVEHRHCNYSHKTYAVMLWDI